MVGFLVYLVLACFSVIDGFGQKVTSTKVKVKVADQLKVSNEPRLLQGLFGLPLQEHLMIV